MRILFTTFYDPAYLGVRYLAAVMKQAGHEVRIVQLKSFRSKILEATDMASHTGYYLYYRQAFSSSGDREFPITPVELGLFEDAIREWQPDIAGFSLRSPYNHLLQTILPAMRRGAPDAFLLGGGFGPTFNPEIPLNLGADAVIRGEGEEALLELAAALEKETDWREIRNLVFLDKTGNVRKNPLRPLIRNLDDQPLALYGGDHFVSIEDDTLTKEDMRLRTSEGILCQSYILLTGRGCIGQCSYCAGGNWRKQYENDGHKAPRLRMRSLDNVMMELRKAKDMGEKAIGFADEYLVRPYDKLCDFFEQYAKEINLPFYAHFHHKQLMDTRNGKKKLLEIVKDSGLTEIPVGVQSGSESFAKRVYYRCNDNKELIDAINCFQKYGLSGNYHIIGANHLETQREKNELYDFCANIAYDPSLLTQWHILGHRLKLLDGSPLAAEHPELKKMPYETAKFAEHILLADLSNKLDAQSFANVRGNPFYKGHPERLHWLLLNVIRDRHQEYLAREIGRLKGREVWFWGGGEMYQYRAHLFHELKPKGILDNTIEPAESGKNFINGLAIIHPDAALPTATPLPIVIFSARAPEIYRHILRHYPQYTDIVACAML